MPQAIIYLGAEEDEMVKKYSEEWNISKHETILRMIREYKEQDG